MDQIEQNHIEVNRLKLHLAESGKGSSAMVFFHGFSEIWYSWRHEMVVVAYVGFRAIALDYRGYGLSHPPPESEKTTFSDFVNDLLAILDAMSICKEPGRSEADFNHFDARTIVLKIYNLFSKPDAAIAIENEEIMDLVDQSSLLPSWFT